MARGWSVITRQDGTRMWAYRGHPVYTFFKDRKPGDAYGQAMVSWIAPPDGGSPITSYTITPFIGSQAQSPTTIIGSPPATTGMTTPTRPPRLRHSNEHA